MQSSHETLSVVEEKKRAEVGIEETVVINEINGGKIQVAIDGGEPCKLEHLSKKDSSSTSSESSSSSESEDEEVGEYQPHHRVTEDVIKEEKEENEDAKEVEGCTAKVVQCVESVIEGSKEKISIEHAQVAEESLVEGNAVSGTPEEKSFIEEAKQDLREEREEEQLKINGDLSHIGIDVKPQIICCSEVNGGTDQEVDYVEMFLRVKIYLPFFSYSPSSSGAHQD